LKTNRFKSACSGCLWRRIIERQAICMSTIFNPAAPDDTDSARSIPKARFDTLPLALIALVMLGAWPLVGSSSTWVTLTAAGLAMGMIVFIAASGLTLVFGLMDVLNFGHSVFIALGAFVATSVFTVLAGWTDSASLALNLAAVLVAMLAAMLLGGAVGLGFERVLVRPVYGQHLKQILVTIGGAIVGEELIKVLWGPAQIALPLPQMLRGSVTLALGHDPAVVERFRLVAVVVGLVVLAALLYTLNRTKVGLLIRAGVQDREMVESLGYRIRRLFVGVFAAGSALAALGGSLWGMNQQIVSPQIGAQVNVLLFIVIIIGGLGSTLGCLVGALAVGLITNYIGFLAPKLTMFASIGLMVAILAWRPQGMYPVVTR
jgi:branched-chain amino acid transport system permease protein